MTGNILLVDDEELVLEAGKEMLEALGVTVYTATNGREAVEMVRKQNVEYRAVVMDISMPEMDGLEAMKEIRKSNADLPILLCSGYSEDHFFSPIDEASKADIFLKKPFRLAELQNSLEKLLP